MKVKFDFENNSVISYNSLTGKLRVCLTSDYCMLMEPLLVNTFCTTGIINFSPNHSQIRGHNNSFNWLEPGIRRKRVLINSCYKNIIFNL